MSVQTILQNSIERLCEKALKGTIENANKLVLQERFKLGEGYCEKDQFHNSLIKEMTEINSNELICHINDIIENDPEECQPIKQHYNGL